MELNSSLQAKLDAPTKAFEVAFRCYIANNLLSYYVDEQSLKKEIQNRIDSSKDAQVILSGKISSAMSLLSTKEWGAFWSNICFSNDCYKKQDQFISHDVVYLSQAILMTYIFQDLHNSLIQSFDTPEKYMYYAQKYYEVRNALSHQGSNIISDADAKACVTFMEKGCSLIAEQFFWFRSVAKIRDDIKAFKQMLYLKEPIVENFDAVPFPSNSIVCRELELSDLLKYVCGWDGTRKLRNRKHLVCVSGYGGIGKTSLVTEFLLQLLELMKSEVYQGLRPEFVLFYSAKVQAMEYDKQSGSLYMKRTRCQFYNCDQLLTQLYFDLSIPAFDESWEQSGILIVDNLETLECEERQKIIDYINYDIPASISVIITTRIPEHADEQMSLRDFKNEAGINFIEKYISKNHINVTLSEQQKQDLVKYSYGNSLVLVLALKRLGAQKATCRSIIGELQRLPKANTDNIISQFMFQNTIEEILKMYPDNKELIKSVLICLSLQSEPLSVNILASAHQNTSVTLDDIDTVLQLLTHYLIVEKIGDTYIINEFANHYILTSMTPSQDAKRAWETKLLTAMHDMERQQMTVKDFKYNFPRLSDVIEEWNGKREEENLAICHAFELYGYKKRITSSNAAFEIEQLNREFDKIEYQYSAHPYIYYQRARILKELRQEGFVGDEYDELIKSNYERCLMLIDTPSFAQIKCTKTYPSILWIFAMFLLSIPNFNEASNHANAAVKNYQRLGIISSDAEDALAIYGIAEINLFSKELKKEHLSNARMVLEKLNGIKNKSPNLQAHLEQLTVTVNKFDRFKTK